MIYDNDEVMLFIEPQHNRTEEPVIDELTIKMFNAFKDDPTEGCYLDVGNFNTALRTMGFHTCVCGKHSTNCDYQLKSGKITNYLCVHYLAYHRADVPESELEKVRSLETSTELLSSDTEALMEMIDQKVVINDRVELAKEILTLIDEM